MQNFFIYLSNYSLGAALGPHHRSAPENFFIYLYVGPDIRVGNATMGGDCPGISPWGEAWSPNDSAMTVLPARQ